MNDSVACGRRAAWRRRPRRWTLAVAAASALAAAGCIDFIDPVIPQAGQPAVLEVAVNVSGDSVAQIDGRVSPGYDGYGLVRRMVDSTLLVLGEPVSQLPAAGIGVVYHDTRRLSVAGGAGVFDIVAPVVEGTIAPGPLRWVGLRRTGPDTLRIAAGEDLVLRIEHGDTLAVTGQAPQTRQWFLQLFGSGPPLRISSDGPPPAVLRIPSQLLPAPLADGSLFADLLYYQSGFVSVPEGSYLLSATLNVALRWRVRVVE